MTDRRWTVLLLAAVLGLAACGGAEYGDDDGDYLPQTERNGDRHDDGFRNDDDGGDDREGEQEDDRDRDFRDDDDDGGDG